MAEAASDNEISLDNETQINLSQQQELTGGQQGFTEAKLSEIKSENNVESLAIDEGNQGGVFAAEEIRDDAQSENGSAGRPKRNAKPSTKSLENYMQKSRQELDKLWGKVTNSISSMQATQTSWKNLRLLIDEVRSNFNTYKASCIEYLDYLMNINSAECKEESEKYENIIDRHKRFVETALSEANEHKRELISEQSMRSGSRVSSTSSVVIRAQARAEAVAAVKKAEMQKKRSALVAQSTIVIEKEKARMEQLYLEEEAAIAIAKANAIDDELGITPDPKELDLPEENSGDKVKFYLEHQCEKTLSNSPRSPSILPHVPTTIQPGLSANETPLQQGPPLHITDPPRHTHVVQQQYDTSFMNSTTPNPLLQDSPLARQYTSQPPVDVTSQPLWLDPRPSRSDQTHFVPPCPIPSNSQTHLVSSHLTAPLMHTPRNSASQPHAYPSIMVKERAPQNAVTLMPQNTTCHHEQIPHPVEPPISQPLNPNAGTFNLKNQPSQDSSQQRADIGSYVEFMARRELISNKIEKFNDKPESYLVWKESFENMIKGVRITASEKLSLLAEYTTGNAKMLVQKLRNAFITNSEAGVKEVWKKLDERYGSSVVLTKVHLNKLTNFPKIGYKENRKLQEFGDLLLELECAKKDGRLQGLRILDEPIYLQPIITKLPGDIQNRWQKHAFRFKNEYKVDYPPFQEFSKFIQNLALERNDPNLTPEIPERETPPSRRAYKTEIKDGEGGTDMLDLSKWCILHRKPHPLSQCRAFRSKPIDQRKGLLKQQGICYRCLASTQHMAKDCKAAIKCSECASERHLSALHIGPPPESGNTGEPKADERTQDGAKPPMPGQEASGYGEEGVKVSTKCTEVCRQSPGGKSCSKICLANIYTADQPERKVRAYVVIDDQSNSSLAKPMLFNKLDLQGETITYTLQTCAGQSQVEGRVAKGVIVESLDGRKSHMLPNLVECSAIPDNKNEIATPQVALAHPHLRPIANKIPELEDDVDILLLVGRDAPPLHKVHESRNGRGNLPWAQRLDLGWVIIGEACLDGAHKPDEVSTFKTQLLHNGRPSTLEPCPNVINVKSTFRQGSNHKTDYNNEPFVEGTFNDGLGKDVFAESKDDNKPGLSIEDRQFINMMEENMVKNNTGNWTAPLPFRHQIGELPESRKAASNRLKSTCRLLERRPETKQHYFEFMERIFEKELAEPVPPEDLMSSKPCWYVPHFGVYHPQKPEKIRVVFDSAAETEGTSLNKLLLSGPDLTNSLLGVLLRFRQNPVAATADIEKMFYSFYVHEEHRDFLRFLWFRNNDPNEVVVDYRMKVHLFGNSSSPAVATFGLKKTAHEGESAFGHDAKEFVDKNFYVDASLKEGDLVLMRDKESPRNDWPLARVSKTFPSQDGNVRKVEVETAREDRKKHYLRPVTELILL